MLALKKYVATFWQHPLWHNRHSFGRKNPSEEDSWILSKRHHWHFKVQHNKNNTLDTHREIQTFLDRETQEKRYKYIYINHLGPRLVVFRFRLLCLYFSPVSSHSSIYFSAGLFFLAGCSSVCWKPVNPLSKPVFVRYNFFSLSHLAQVNFHFWRPLWTCLPSSEELEDSFCQPVRIHPH